MATATLLYGYRHTVVRLPPHFVVNLSFKTIILFKDGAILVYTNFFCSVCNF